MSCLHHLFEREVDLHPESPAIVCGDAAMSYAQVEERANQLARHLRSHGVGTGEIVGLMVERSPDAILAILSILKAGAAYLPLDPSHPPERIRHILAEASITTVVSEGKLGADALGVLDAAGASVVAIDDPCQPWQALSTMRLSAEQTGVAPSDLCYVLYTSGSTGRPKGVMAEHRNVVEFVKAFNEVIRLTDQDRVFQGFSLGFDGSVEEMWMAFSNGAALVVPERGAARFGDDLALLVAGGNVTVFSTVPTSLAMMTHALPSVRLLIVSGERCPPEAVARWATPGRRMLNVYGPTETTVNTTVAECAPGQPVTIGRPLGGYGLHVLDEDGRPVARGERGELFISGPCLARGYLGQRELTDERFGPLPAASGAAGTRAYRTGDLVSVGERGELLFHGRLDTQVKVRGYRIELSEIESVLLEDAAIRAAAVIAVEGDGARDGAPTLAAYVVARDLAAGIDRNRLLANLGARLPAYMVPAFLDVLEAFPTLPSGKVDRKQLPKPLAALVRTDRAMRAPNDALEADLLATYARVLRNDAISIDDDFFLALGGYSLLAAQLVSELRKDLGVEVAIRDVYNHPTIAALAVHLRAKGAGERRAPARAPAANGHRVDSAGDAAVDRPGGARAARGVRGCAGAGPVPDLRGDGAAVLGPALHGGGLAPRTAVAGLVDRSVAAGGDRRLAGAAAAQHRREVDLDRPLPPRRVPAAQRVLPALLAGAPVPADLRVGVPDRDAVHGAVPARDGRPDRARLHHLDGILRRVRSAAHRRRHQHRRRDPDPRLPRPGRHAPHRLRRHRQPLLHRHARGGRPRRLDERRRAARRSVAAARPHAHPRGRGAARLARATGRGSSSDAGHGPGSRPAAPPVGDAGRAAVAGAGGDLHRAAADGHPGLDADLARRGHAPARLDAGGDPGGRHADASRCSACGWWCSITCSCPRSSRASIASTASFTCASGARIC